MAKYTVHNLSVFSFELSLKTEDANFLFTIIASAVNIVRTRTVQYGGESLVLAQNLK